LHISLTVLMIIKKGYTIMNNVMRFENVMLGFSVATELIKRCMSSFIVVTTFFFIGFLLTSDISADKFNLLSIIKQLQSVNLNILILSLIFGINSMMRTRGHTLSSTSQKMNEDENSTPLKAV